MSQSIKARQHVERQIVTAAINAAINAGYFVSVNDGEETTLIDSKDTQAILAAMFTTDEDWLYVRMKQGPKHSGYFGWMRFIYGNDGWDVLSDYTVNLDPIMPSVNAEIEKWSD